MDFPTGKYGCIYADPPWDFKTWSGKPNARGPQNHYNTMEIPTIAELPVAQFAAENCVLFMWICWPTLLAAEKIFQSWGFDYKTCAFCWVKAKPLPLFPDDMRDQMGLGYWTRANSEVCLLATRGKPKRKHADVRQAILEPRREHSRKPDCVYDRIERLVDGPYLELFARQTRPGWDSWGLEVNKFGEMA